MGQVRTAAENHDVGLPPQMLDFREFARLTGRSQWKVWRQYRLREIPWYLAPKKLRYKIADRIVAARASHEGESK